MGVIIYVFYIPIISFINFRSMRGAALLSHVPLFTVPFWIQVHHLPPGYMSERVGQHIATTLGEFLEYDPNNHSQIWRRYMRLRALLDVRRPLKKTRRLKKKDGSTCDVQLKYERHDTFCYYCGLLGHVDDSCDLLYEIDEDDGRRQWGPELRVELYRRGQEGEGKPMHDQAKHESWSRTKTSTLGLVEGSSKTTSSDVVGEGKNFFVELMKNPNMINLKKKQEVEKNIDIGERVGMDVEEVGVVVDDKKKKYNEDENTKKRGKKKHAIEKDTTRAPLQHTMLDSVT